jgi:demethylmenaquinone methyltransferase/2-methoxy-6-polyprenyl-1,4-benzoquinol methylase
VNGHFDFLAPFYDRVIRFDRLARMQHVLALPVDGILLDAGGGTGRVAAALRPHLRQVIVADVSWGMLRQARGKALPASAAETECLPFPSGLFERVLMVDALHHVFHQAQTLSELWRVLKPGGRLVIEEPDIRHWVVKGIALAEKLALMRSHFLAPAEIAALLPPEARISIETEHYNAWVIAEK